MLGRNGSRLKAHHHVFDDGTVATRSAFATWIDTETGQGCRFDVAADDVVRCLPSGPHFQLEAIRYYDDPACRQPLYLANPCNDDPLGPPKFALLGAAVTPAAVYAYDDTQVPARCVPVEQLDPVQEQTTVAELLAHHDLRPLGPEVAPSMFVRASPPRLR